MLETAGVTIGMEKRLKNANQNIADIDKKQRTNYTFIEKY